MYLDLESVPCVKSFNDLDERGKALYVKKFGHQMQEVDPRIPMDVNGNLQPELMQTREQIHFDANASFHAEFSKVLCVSVGFESDEKTFRVKTIINRNEKVVLEEVAKIIERAPKLIAHNGKSFDYPFLFRRFIINGIRIPTVLNTTGKKPWEVNLEDTMETWKSTSFKDTASLDLIAWTLNLPSPKTDIDGSRIKELYYIQPKDGVLIFDHDEPIFKRIGAYCEGDVITLANVDRKFKGLPIFTEDKIVRV